MADRLDIKDLYVKEGERVYLESMRVYRESIEKTFLLYGFGKLKYDKNAYQNTQKLYHIDKWYTIGNLRTQKLCDFKRTQTN